MIASFKSRKLKRLHERGDRSQIRPDMLSRVERVLFALDTAINIEELFNLQGYRMHALTGDLKGFWSLSVSRSWRIIFRFENGHVYDVELIDYH